MPALFSGAALAPYVQQAIQEQASRPTPVSEGRLHPAALATLLGGQGFDLGTTLAALSNGAREANPVLGQDPSKLAAMKALSMLGQWLLLRKLAEQHPKIANGIAIGSGALGAGIGVHNLKQMK
jgi:hypothetical protein